MELTAQQMIHELLMTHNISKGLLADKFGVDSRTIYRWWKAESKPRSTAMKYIRQVYNGYARFTPKQEVEGILKQADYIKGVTNDSY